MKKIISILLCAFILTSYVCVSASANTGSNNAFNYVVDGVEYTVKFVDSELSEEEEAFVAERLVGIENNTPTPRGLCDLLGHDYKYGEAHKYTHKARSTAPRCIESVYKITYCSDCDYYVETFLDSNYIYCC